MNSTSSFALFAILALWSITSANSAPAVIQQTGTSTINEPINKLRYRFAEPREGREFVHPGGILKTWSPPDRKRINDIMYVVEHKFGTLLDAASSGRNLSFFRVASFGEDMKPVWTTRSSEVNIQQCLACSSPGAIFYPDEFFYDEWPRTKKSVRSDKQCIKTVVHELVHCADPGDLVAYSSEWFDYLRQTAKSKNSSDTVAPLEEMLASYFSRYALGEAIPSRTRFEQLVVRRLIAPNESHRQFNTLMREGITAKSKENFSLALSCFSKAATIEPSSPLVYTLITVVDLRVHDKSAASEHSAAALSRFDMLGVTLDEPRCMAVLQVRADLLYQHGDIFEAQKLAQRALKKQPHNKWANHLTKACREQLSLTR